MSADAMVPTATMLGTPTLDATKRTIRHFFSFRNINASSYLDLAGSVLCSKVFPHSMEASSGAYRWRCH